MKEEHLYDVVDQKSIENICNQMVEQSHSIQTVENTESEDENI